MLTLNEAATETVAKIAAVKKAFGAPGDWGYGNPQGESLYGLYLAAANLDQAIEVERAKVDYAPMLLEALTELIDHAQPDSNYDEEGRETSPAGPWERAFRAIYIAKGLPIPDNLHSTS